MSTGGKKIMAEKIDKKELLLANTIKIDTLCLILVEKGIVTEEEFFNKLKAVQAEYNKKIGE